MLLNLAEYVDKIKGMRLPFNEAKATEAAALLLELGGGSMSYLKLIKLLYLADREALLEWGRPVTTDRYVSMDHGPVVSQIYGLISVEPEPGQQSVWHRHVAKSAWDVTLRTKPEFGELSRAEEELLARVFDVHGHKDKWTLVDETHSLPEWEDPHGSSSPISYKSILRAGGKSEDETMEVLHELQSLNATQRILRRAG